MTTVLRQGVAGVGHAGDSFELNGLSRLFDDYRAVSSS